jgi:uncharacterized membrane protein YidH (DUF202 family)
MKIWAITLLGLLTFEIILKILCLGILDYPRETRRSQDMVDIFYALFLIAWGLLAIFKG